MCNNIKTRLKTLIVLGNVLLIAILIFAAISLIYLFNINSKLQFDKTKLELANIKLDVYSANNEVINNNQKQVEQYKKMEKKLIPEELDYDEVPSLRLEARQKLKMFKPVSVGQASRISGVSPADIAVLVVYMEQYGRNKKGEL